MGFPGGSNGKEFACTAGDPGSLPRSERSPGKGNGNPLQYFCLKNSMDIRAWRATVHGVQSQTPLSNYHAHLPLKFSSYLFQEIKNIYIYTKYPINILWILYFLKSSSFSYSDFISLCKLVLLLVFCLGFLYYSHRAFTQSS